MKPCNLCGVDISNLHGNCKICRDCKGVTGEPAVKIRKKRKKQKGVRDHAQVIKKLYSDGWTLRQIGEKYSVTRERIRQILKQEYGFTGESGGQKKSLLISNEKKKAEKDRVWMQKYGISYDRVVGIKLVGGSPFKSYRTQKKNARNRGIDFTLTFKQWWDVWQKSGKWELRGRGSGSYCMCRKGDEGGYSKDNVFIGSVEENTSDGVINGIELVQLEKELDQQEDWFKCFGYFNSFVHPFMAQAGRDAKPVLQHNQGTV